jgi:hypothetical protein
MQIISGMSRHLSITKVTLAVQFMDLIVFFMKVKNLQTMDASVNEFLYNSTIGMCVKVKTNCYVYYLAVKIVRQGKYRY